MLSLTSCVPDGIFKRMRKSQIFGDTDLDNTYTTGTIRIHRGVPKELVDTKLSELQACFIRKNDALLLKFKDKRDVYVSITKLTANFVEKN